MPDFTYFLYRDQTPPNPDSPRAEWMRHGASLRLAQRGLARASANAH